MATFALSQTVGTEGDPGAGWWGWNGCATHRNAFGDMAIASAFGLFLVAIRQGDSWYLGRLWLSVPLGWLGAISYSLYLTHNYNLRITEVFARAIAGSIGLGTADAWVEAIQVTCLVAIAGGFYVVAERPFLNRPVQTANDPFANHKAGNPCDSLAASSPMDERSSR